MEIIYVCVQWINRNTLTHRPRARGGKGMQYACLIGGGDYKQGRENVSTMRELMRKNAAAGYNAGKS